MAEPAVPPGQRTAPRARVQHYAGHRRAKPSDRLQVAFQNRALRRNPGSERFAPEPPSRRPYWPWTTLPASFTYDWPGAWAMLTANVPCGVEPLARTALALP